MANLYLDKHLFSKPLYEIAMKLIINGETYDELQAGMSVLDLLSYLNLPKAKIAVELNREIVPKSGYLSAALKDGDKLEIITFIGGG